MMTDAELRAFLKEAFEELMEKRKAFRSLVDEAQNDPQGFTFNARITTARYAELVELIDLLEPAITEILGTEE